MDILNNYQRVWLARGTSPVDWCEANYAVTPYIAEFVNTFTNVFFLLIPVACAPLWRSYAHNVSRGIDVMFVMYPMVGLSSAYFHATLSLLGQMLDELSILWTMMFSYSLFTPYRYRPAMVKENPAAFRTGLAFLGFITTVCAFMKPYVNHYALFVTAIPVVHILITETRLTADKKIRDMAILSLVIAALSFMLWVIDRFMCDRLSLFNLYFLHGLWHVLILVASYIAQVLVCYFYAYQDVPESRPAIMFYYGLPYVQCKSKDFNKCP